VFPMVNLVPTAKHLWGMDAVQEWNRVFFFFPESGFNELWEGGFDDRGSDPLQKLGGESPPPA
jgi:hypothetical protein